jgi:hypothetical protein
MSSRTVLVRTDGSGDFTYERPFFGSIRAISVDIGDLATPDIEVSDAVSGTTVRTLSALAVDDYWQAGTPVVVFGTLRVVVTGGGATKSGRIRILTET